MSVEAKKYRPNRQPQRCMSDMGRPDLWPQWPYLPLKRYPEDNTAPQFGYLLDVGGPERFCIFLGNMFAAKPATDIRQTYTSFQEIVDDGWEVD